MRRWSFVRKSDHRVIGLSSSFSHGMEGETLAVITCAKRGKERQDFISNRLPAERLVSEAFFDLRPSGDRLSPWLQKVLENSVQNWAGGVLRQVAQMRIREDAGYCSGVACGFSSAPQPDGSSQQI